MERRIAVAVSGGVDSLCALLLLKRAGHDVFALHGRFLSHTPSCFERLRQLCGDLSVEFHVADLSSGFLERVIRPFSRAWLEGKTPNPCAACNRDIKFGVLLDCARKLGASCLATGHYARISDSEYGKKLLAPARDAKKDQSYFLSLLPGTLLKEVLFPLGEYTKEECRELVRQMGLTIPHEDESQDICFLDKNENRTQFILKYMDCEPAKIGKEGPIILRRKNGEGEVEELMVGRHRGLMNYTTGQRKGLGIPYSEALYVLDKDVTGNRLIVAPARCLRLMGCTVRQPNYFLSAGRWPGKLYSRLRYRQQPAEVRAEIVGDKIQLHFKEAQFPSAIGQLATVEDACGRILAAGLIEEMRFD